MRRVLLKRNDNRDPVKNRSFPWTILLIFLFLMAGVAVAGYLFNRSQRIRIETDVHRELNAVADLKVRQIENWLQERYGDGRMILKSRWTQEKLAAYVTAPSPELEGELRGWMNSLRRYYGYWDVLLDDAAGNVRLSLESLEGASIGPEGFRLMAEVKNSRDTILSGFHRSKKVRRIHLDLVVPVLGPAGSGEPSSSEFPVTGALFLRIDPERFLFPLIQSWPTPSRSAETLLVKREGSEVVYLNELRHRQNTALNLRFPVDKSDLPAAIAVRGKEGIMDGRDYRGVPVLAASRWIRNTSWFMVAKIDRDEVFTPLRRQTRFTILVMFLLIAISGSGLVMAWRHQRALYYRSLLEKETRHHALTRHFEYLVRYANDIIVLFDDQMKITEVNDRAIQTYGYDREELIGLPVTVLRPPELKPGILEKMKEAEGRDGIVYETMHVRNDGSSFPVEISLRLIDVEGRKFYQGIIRDITERKKVEEALRESEERFRSLYENATIGLYRTTPDGRILMANPALVRMLGHETFKDLSQHNLEQEGFEPEYPRNEFRQRIETHGEVNGLESAWKRRDGKIIFVRESAKAICDENGNVRYYEGTVEDITERKRSEEELRQSEEKYRGLFENAEVGMYRSRLDGSGIVALNQRLADIFGFTKEEMLGSPATLRWADPKAREEMLRVLRERGELRDHELDIVTKGGEVRTLLASMKLYSGEGYLEGTAIDITDRKLAEEKLYESEFRFNKLYENGPFGMVMADKEFLFKKANPAFCTIMGYEEEEIRKISFKDITHPDDLNKDLINIQKLIRKELAVYKTEKRYIRKDGQEIWGSLTVTTNYDSEGQFLYFLGIIEDITERKLAAEALQESRIRLELALNSSHSGVWDWDLSSNKIVWSSQMYDLFGADKNIALASFDTWRAALHPDDKEQAELKIADAIKNHISLQNEYRVILPAGNIRWINAKGEAIYGSSGEPLRMIGICMDITEQKLAAEKIREKDQEFRKLSANVPGLIYQFTRRPDGTYFVPIASEGIRNIFGCTPEDVLEDFTPIGRVIYQEDMERVIHDIEYSAEHLTYFSCEFRVQIPGREIQWIYSNSTPERLADGSITWYGFNVDITHKRLAEEQLRKLNRIYLLLSDINKAIVHTRVPKELFARVCEIAVEQGGFGMVWIGLIDEASQKLRVIAQAGRTNGYLEHVNISLKGNPVSYCPVDSALRQGKHIICKIIEHEEMAPCQKIAFDLGLRSSASLPLKVSGTLKGALTFYSDEADFFDEVELKLLDEMTLDISFAMEYAEKEAERKQAHEEIRRLNLNLEERVIQRTTLLEAANKELEAFSYSVSHDLRAPLRAIAGFAQVLGEENAGKLGSEGLRVLEVIRANTRNMGQLIDDLLAFSRLSRQRMALGDINMATLADDVFCGLKDLEKERRIEFKVGALPSAFGDRSLLQQVLQNLLANALKFTAKRKTGTIEIGFRQEPGEQVYWVRDNGVGFDMKYVHKLYGVFQRLHSQMEFEGTGVGLAIVQRIILRHGGRVWAEGAVGKGATFYFSLPIKKDGEA
jgi:PAS domain S-box-containing protein